MEDIILPLLASAVITYASVWYLRSFGEKKKLNSKEVNSKNKSKKKGLVSPGSDDTYLNKESSTSNNAIKESSSSSPPSSQNIWIVEDTQAKVRQYFVGERLALLYCCFSNSEQLVKSCKEEVSKNSAVTWQEVWSNRFKEENIEPIPTPFLLIRALKLKKRKLIDLCNNFLQATKNINQFIGRLVSKKDLVAKTDIEGLELLRSILSQSGKASYREFLNHQQNPPGGREATKQEKKEEKKEVKKEVKKIVLEPPTVEKTPVKVAPTPSVMNPPKEETDDDLLTAPIQVVRGRRKKKKKKKRSKIDGDDGDDIHTTTSSKFTTPNTTTIIKDTPAITADATTVGPLSTTANVRKTKADHTYDKGYKKWETFDVDAELNKIDKQDAKDNQSKMDQVDDSTENETKNAVKLKSEEINLDDMLDGMLESDDEDVENAAAAAAAAAATTAATTTTTTTTTTTKDVSDGNKTDDDDDILDCILDSDNEEDKRNGEVDNNDDDDDILDAMLNSSSSDDDQLDNLLNDALDSDDDDDVDSGISSKIIDFKERSALRLLNSSKDRERWCKILEKDRIRQSAMPPSKPLSRMLLSLMPKKSRARQMAEHRQQEHLDINEIFNRTLIKSLVQSGVVKRGEPVKLNMSQNELEELKMEYKSIFRKEIKRRLTRDKDFNEERFPKSYQEFMC